LPSAVLRHDAAFDRSGLPRGRALPVELSLRYQTWPAARVERLRELVAQGLSAAAIARALGTSRNSVLGARRRYTRAGPASALPPMPRRTLARVRPPEWLPRSPLPVPHPADLLLAGVALLELGRHACRWPLPQLDGGVTRRFCGAPAAAGSSYCAGHLERSRA